MNCVQLNLIIGEWGGGGGGARGKKKWWGKELEWAMGRTGWGGGLNGCIMH
jgi:hypothetical protein